MASKAGKTGDVVSVGGGSTVTQPAAVGGVSGGGSSGRKSQLLLDIEKIRRDIQEILSDDVRIACEFMAASACAGFARDPESKRLL